MEKFSENELFVTLPYAHLQSAVASLDACTAGTAETEIPAGMRRLMEESGEELPEL
jgi:hypothetical protein